MVARFTKKALHPKWVVELYWSSNTLKTIRRVTNALLSVNLSMTNGFTLDKVKLDCVFAGFFGHLKKTKAKKTQANF